MKKIAKSKHKTEMAKLESKSGCRYSILPYFDPVRMHLIDPMHNLYLGTAGIGYIDRTRNTNQETTETEKTTGSSWHRHDIGTLLNSGQTIFLSIAYGISFQMNRWNAGDILY